jgi:hypothetical protein
MIAVLIGLVVIAVLWKLITRLLLLALLAVLVIAAVAWIDAGHHLSFNHDSGTVRTVTHQVKRDVHRGEHALKRATGA